MRKCTHSDSYECTFSHWPESLTVTLRYRSDPKQSCVERLIIHCLPSTAFLLADRIHVVLQAPWVTPRVQRRSYAPTPRHSPPDYPHPPWDHLSGSPHMSRREPFRGTGAPPPERDGYYACHGGNDSPSWPSMMGRRSDHTERRVSFSYPSN